MDLSKTIFFLLVVENADLVKKYELLTLAFKVIAVHFIPEQGAKVCKVLGLFA
jgi:hypothetical protein